MEQQPPIPETNILYPGISDRVKAAVTDGIITILFAAIFAQVFSQFTEVSGNTRMLAFVFIFILYDPLFTHVFGGTIGHYIVGIRVKRISNPSKNLSLLSAIARFIVKASLGWLSLLTIGNSEKKQAIHDIAVKSVVVNR